MEQAASENYRQAQEGATRSAREIETVAEYLRDMQGGEDAQTALNGLVSQLFVQSQQEWMRQNPDADLDEAMQRFADALKRYRTENTALSTALEGAGFAAGKNGGRNTALSYAADQLLALEERTGEEAGVQYQIKHGITKGGREVSYVQADRQVISGTDSSKWGQQVTNFINQQIRKGKDVTFYSENGVPLTITKDTAGKAAYRNSYADRTPYSDSDYALKLRIESHIDEAAQVSIGKKGKTQDTKNHAFAREGFSYRTAYFLDADGKYYSFQISVGRSNGINSIYNVNEIKEAELPNTLKGAHPQNVKVGLTASKTSISNSEENVNEQLSMKDTGDTDLDMKDEDVARSVEDDAELFAQVTEDQDAREALELVNKLDESTGDLTKGQWESRRGDVADPAAKKKTG